MIGRTNLVAVEQDKYAAIFAIDQYSEHSPGEKFVDAFCDMASVDPSTARNWVLDVGCGSGKGAVALAKAGFGVVACDFVDGRTGDATAIDFQQIDSLWSTDLRGQFGVLDYVYCTDVLEHIPTEFTMLVVANLLRVARVGVFLSISTVDDVFGYFVGEPLHKTVRSYAWWRGNLAELGEVVESRDVMNAGLFFIRPRQ